MSNEKHEYTVRQEGFFYGAFRKVGDRLRLTAKQAKYELMARNLYELGKEPHAEGPRTPVVEVEAPKQPARPARPARRRVSDNG